MIRTGSILAMGLVGVCAFLAGTVALAQEEARGRFVPERRDDFAWENDRIAFRVYGPACSPVSPS